VQWCKEQLPDRCGDCRRLRLAENCSAATARLPNGRYGVDEASAAVWGAAMALLLGTGGRHGGDLQGDRGGVKRPKTLK
jgi:hypothetical protein